MNLKQIVHASDYESLLALEHGTFFGYRVAKPVNAGAVNTTFACLSAESGKVTVLYSIEMPTAPLALMEVAPEGEQTLEAKTPQPWERHHAYHVGDEIGFAQGKIRIATVAGTSGTDEPGWAEGTIADGSVIWSDFQEAPHHAKTHYRFAKPASVAEPGNWTLIKISHDALTEGHFDHRVGASHTG